MGPTPTLDQSLSIGERIASSAAPALVFSIFLMLVLGAAVAYFVLQLMKRVGHLETGMSNCEKNCAATKRLMFSRNARKTALLLEVLSFTESVLGALTRAGDSEKFMVLKKKAADLMNEEIEEANRDVIRLEEEAA